MRPLLPFPLIPSFCSVRLTYVHKAVLSFSQKKKSHKRRSVGTLPQKTVNLYSKQDLITSRLSSRLRSQSRPPFIIPLSLARPRPSRTYLHRIPILGLPSHSHPNNLLFRTTPEPLQSSLLKERSPSLFNPSNPIELPLTLPQRPFTFTSDAHTSAVMPKGSKRRKEAGR